MLDPFLLPGQNIGRLMQEYRLHGTLAIGFDFDNTIYDYHHEGHIYPEVIALLKECSELGLTMCCYTGNTDEKLVREYCTSNGIKVDFLNESPIKSVSVPHKPFFSILLDDRAGLRAAVTDLSIVLFKIKELK